VGFIILDSFYHDVQSLVKFVNSSNLYAKIGQLDCLDSVQKN